MSNVSPPDAEQPDRDLVAADVDALAPQALDDLAAEVLELIRDDLLRQRERRGLGPGRWS